MAFLSFAHKPIALTTFMFFRNISVMLAVFACCLAGQPSYAQSTATGQTGLPLPRFVSLKSEKVNMRIGPGRQFKVDWMYLRKGLPMEIIQEYDNWRKVRDQDGNEGWILHSLLSGLRTAVVAPWDKASNAQTISMYREASATSQQVARLQPGVVAEVLSCEAEWCRLTVQDTEGFVEKKSVWGVYSDELIE